MSPDYIRAVPTIDLPDDELAAVTEAIRGVIAGDRYPHAPRLDPLRAALARLEAATNRQASQSRCRRPRRQPKPTSGRGDNRLPYGGCYLRPSIHSVSACEPRPSAASAAALYPRIALARWT